MDSPMLDPNRMPSYGPFFKDTRRGKYKATTQIRKQDCKLCDEWHDLDIAVANASRIEELKAHVQAVAEWQHHYITYYKLTGWELRVVWEGFPTPDGPP